MAKLKITPKVLEHLLDLPEGIDIIGVEWDETDGLMNFEVTGDYDTEDGKVALEEDTVLSGVWENTEEGPGIRMVAFQQVV